MSALKGAFPVLCTPFRDDGTVDEADFRSLIGFVRDCGADGCVFPGVASEVTTLSPEERARLIALLGEELAGAMPFIVGASEDTPQGVIDRMAEGQAVGASAAMVMAPGHLGKDIAAHTAFFKEVGAGSDLPILLQNAPVPIGAGLAPEDVAAIARAVPEVRFCKEETMPCGQNLTRIMAAAGDAIEGVFGGAGGRYITDELARGSLGTMPASEFADLHVALVNAWAEGREDEARRLFEVSMPLLNFQAIFRMHMTKGTLKRRGVIANTFVRGAGPKMDAGDARELHALLDRISPELTLFPLGPAPQDD
ncbi:4-hydroxy-tetrahydrodipicolinate synthase [Aliiruegeria haliotis]|uniref:4-hydroxy-tetrahydrodipicolinate synthase n=1 Tax=Aliiruegeria haliotis TaxID=1280846 RepID=A0A2T0RMB6_9RHOB|nr:dihydrodipicolinate synthase family protein [Aliiruegeria haliotis]PRY22262.1 4-hydroxy-tetrahydrodipicolinate synthase [Aliiruegeria haliotis]